MLGETYVANTAQFMFDPSVVLGGLLDGTEKASID
jgi:hypothetical protein